MNRANDDACLDKSVVGMKPATKICLCDTLHFHGCMFFRLIIFTPIWSKVYKQGKVEMNNLFFEDCPMSLISFFAELPKYQGWAALWTSVESFKFSAGLFSRLSFFFSIGHNFVDLLPCKMNKEHVSQYYGVPTKRMKIDKKGIGLFFDPELRLSNCIYLTNINNWKVLLYYIHCT